jgi:hypothetical protein
MRLSSLGVRRSLSLGGFALLAIVVGFAAKSSASAPKTITTTLYTPLAGDATGGAGISCRIVNVSAVTHQGNMQLIQVFQGASVVIFDFPTLLGPGQSQSETGVGSPYFAYCKFTVDGPASDVRAEVTADGPDGSPTMVLPAN